MKKQLMILMLVGLQLAYLQILQAHVLVNEKTPSKVVDELIRAYNRRDLASFTALFSEDVEVYWFTDQLMYKGKEKLEESYRSFFDATPNLNCELLERTITGNRVKDEVLIRRVKNSAPSKATILYQVENGIVTKMYFI